MTKKKVDEEMKELRELFVVDEEIKRIARVQVNLGYYKTFAAVSGLIHVHAKMLTFDSKFLVVHRTTSALS